MGHIRVLVCKAHTMTIDFTKPDGTPLGSVEQNSTYALWVTVPAICRGPLALHPRIVDITPTGIPILDRKNAWTVTHVPTGRAIVKSVPCVVGRQLLRVLPQVADWETMTFPLPSKVAKKLKRAVDKLVKEITEKVGSTNAKSG